MPRDAESLRKTLPGVGPYTAGAVASIAFRQPAELVDGNVIRVLSRLRAIGADVMKKETVEVFWKLARKLVHPVQPGDLNQALMELGATVCTPTNPACSACPVKTSCRAYQQQQVIDRNARLNFGTAKRAKPTETSKDTRACQWCLADDSTLSEASIVMRYPVKTKKKPSPEEAFGVFIVEVTVEDQPLYLLLQRPEKGLLANLWEFPTIALDSAESEEASIGDTTQKIRSFLERQLQLELGNDFKSASIGCVSHIFSHLRHEYQVEHIRVTASISNFPSRSR